MRNSIPLISTAVFAVGACLLPATAQAETLFWDGTNEATCVIEVTRQGTLAANSDLTVLSSSEGGGVPVEFTVSTNGDASVLDDTGGYTVATAPSAFNVANANILGGLNLSGATTGSSVQLAATTLTIGQTSGVYDLSLSATDGSQLPAGAYRVQKEITCSPGVQTDERPRDR